VTFVTVLYPAVHSIRAIQSPDKDDDKHWLTYWMVFGLFNFLETFVGCVLAYVPYYAYIRLALFAWLMLPQFQGSKYLYESHIKEFMIMNNDTI